MTRVFQYRVFVSQPAVAVCGMLVGRTVSCVIHHPENCALGSSRQVRGAVVRSNRRNRTAARGSAEPTRGNKQARD